LTDVTDAVHPIAGSTFTALEAAAASELSDFDQRERVASLAAAEGARRRVDTPAAATARVQGPRVHGLGTEGVVLITDAPAASAALASSAYGAAAAVAFHPSYGGVVAVGTSAGHVLLTPMSHRTGITDDVAGKEICPAPQFLGAFGGQEQSPGTQNIALSLSRPIYMSVQH